jgi:ABC-type multidrug transport system ATPase subunit
MPPVSPGGGSGARGLCIEARGVRRQAGSVSLLHGVTFTAYPGEVVALIGPSGAGKSTLLHCLNGYTPPDAGRVLYDGEDLYGARTRLARITGYVPQDDVVHASLTVESTLTYSMRLRQPAAALDAVCARVDEVLDLVGLTDRRHLKVARLSGGQRKRVCIGIELVADPGVLFLDEPTSGLDPALEEKMMTLFQSLARAGRTVLLTTHVMDSIDRVDHVSLLYSGRLAFFGSPAQALAYFRVNTMPDTYRRLGEESPDTWQARFQTSPLAEQARHRPRTARDGTDAVPAAVAPADPVEALLAKLEKEIHGG